MSIEGKVAIVTGASSGIGYATALALSKAGAKVAIGARRTDFVDQVVKKWGTVDILVNNAGLMPLSFIKNLKVDEWEQMIDVNIKGVLFCTAAVIPHLKEKKSGHIVNISSVAGRVVFPSGSVYCATKHAVTALSEGLRQEFSTRSNIRVTCIEPGVVETELLNTITDDSLQSFVEAAKKTQSLRAEDIANTILFLLLKNDKKLKTIRRFNNFTISA